jgi:hypothetical protein
MREIMSLVWKLLKFWGRKTVDLLWALAKMWLGRQLWKWGIRVGLMLLLVGLGAVVYYLFK